MIVQMNVLVDMDELVEVWEDRGLTATPVGVRLAARKYLRECRAIFCPTCAILNQIGEELLRTLRERGLA